METYIMGFFDKAPILASFLAGILTFLSPCILPLVPAYISYITGLSIEEAKEARKSRVMLSSLIFVFGFCIVFILLSIFVSTFFGRIFSNQYATYIAGGIIILFGLHIMGILKIKQLYVIKKIEFKKTQNSLLSPLLLGISFSLGWSPCVGPILASILALSMTQENQSLILIIAYSAGLSIPFLALAFSIKNGIKVIKKLTKYLRILEIISGLLLIAIGLMIAFGKIGVLTELLSI